MKVSVIGYSGSGKSTLAKKLSEISDVPLLYLDKVRFLPGWKERPEQECIEIIENFLKNNEWVIDGNYNNWLYDRRMKESDLIIFMNLSRIRCFIGALKRYLTYKKKRRESITEGCPEKLDSEFVKWVLHEGRKADRRKRFNSVCGKYSDKTIICRSRRDVKAKVLNKSFIHECR